MTVLVSSHNLRELEDVCDHVGIMFNGKLVLEKQLDDVKEKFINCKLPLKMAYHRNLKTVLIFFTKAISVVSTLV